jgi:HNH endonuclease
MVDRSREKSSGRWVFKATAFKSPSSMGFVGYGDADPPNVSSLVRGAELRIAETRAVNRALRKAYGIGLCSVEELRVLECQALQRDAWRCQICGSPKDLQVHHLTKRSRLGDDVLDNLITLCAPCHDLQHHCPSGST